MKRRRVKITGIGPVTPAGVGRVSFAEEILKPVSRVTRIKRFPDEAGAFVAAEVRDFKFEDLVPSFPGKRLPRHTQFAVAGAQLAMADAGITAATLRRSTPAVIIGASLMDFGSINKGVDLILRRGPINGLPTTVFTANVSSIGGTVSEYLGGSNRVLSLQSSCCAGLDAIGHAADLIATGQTDFALCGGTESPLYFHPMLELKMAGLAPGNPEAPQRQCRPFDLWRTTGVIGEGACIFLLEPEESPRRAYAFVEGYAFASDPNGRPAAGLVDAIRLAMANASVNEDAVECISAWGPGHRLIDAGECTALREVFGRHLPSIPAYSIKGAVGNPLGAAGAIQVAAAALAFETGAIPPTVNWQYPDPECALNLSGRSRHVAHGSALVNSHGLSGTNACLVLKR